MRKYIFLFFLLTIPSIVLAANVTLAWDASTTANVAGYGIFNKNYQQPYNYAVPLWDGGLVTTCTVAAPDDRQTAFVARAYVWGAYDLNGNRSKVWSADSNEVIYTPATTAPAPPRNLIIRILTAIGNFFKHLFRG